MGTRREPVLKAGRTGEVILIQVHDSGALCITFFTGIEYCIQSEVVNEAG